MTFDDFCNRMEMTDEEADAAWLHLIVYRAMKMLKMRITKGEK